MICAVNCFPQIRQPFWTHGAKVSSEMRVTGKRINEFFLARKTFSKFKKKKKLDYSGRNINPIMVPYLSIQNTNLT